MKTILRKELKSSDVLNDGYELNITNSEEFVIQLDGSASLKIQGKMSESENYFDLSMIKLSDFTTTSDISEEGIYSAGIEGFDSIKILATNADTNAKIIIKVVA